MTTSAAAEAKKTQVVQDRDRIIRLESDVDGLKTGVERLGKYVEHMDQKLEEYFERLFKSKAEESRDRLRDSQDKGKVWFSAAIGLFGVVSTVAGLNYWAMLATVRPIEVELSYSRQEIGKIQSDLSQNTSRVADQNQQFAEKHAVTAVELSEVKSEVDRLRRKGESP